MLTIKNYEKVIDQFEYKAYKNLPFILIDFYEFKLFDN